MLPFYRKYWRTAFDIGLIVLTVYLIMFAFSHIYRIATPIIFALVIFVCIEPLARRLNKWGITKSIASGISIGLFTLIILALFSAAAFLITKQGTDLINKYPMYQKILTQQISNLAAELELQIGKLPSDINLVDSAREFLQNISGKIGGWLKLGVEALIGYFSTITSFIINLAIGVVLAYFLSIEIKSWKKVAAEKTPRTFKLAFHFLRQNVFKGIGTYIKAQAKLISVTFVVIFAALLILNVKGAFTFSAVAAIFDILPLLGVSTLFIPWITYLFIVGQTSLALWLTALWLVVILTRQVLEPKITGNSLGVSAFTMLSFMILSLSLFGIAGVIMSPILVILLKSLYDQGYLHSWIRAPLDEFDEFPVEATPTNQTKQPKDKKK